VIEARAMTMTVNLGEALERAVEAMVATGRYGSRSEVLREGVRLVEEREQQMAKLRRDMQAALADVETRGTISVDDARGMLDAKLAALEAAQA
jgi:antitoxin ParD1/3/4